MNFTETEILEKLDLAFQGIPSDDFPDGNEEDIKYNFFIDLEHGYFETAGNKIHLYGDKNRWAIVFEKCGYLNRGGAGVIELDYIGNCIDYPISKYPERSYITNCETIELVSSEEYERIRNKKGSEMEQFELISPEALTINIHERNVPIDQDINKYIKLGIQPREFDNPEKLIGYGDIIRFYNETYPELVSATEIEIMTHLPTDIPKIMTISEFHYISSHDAIFPSNQETFLMIAKILSTGDTSFWKPTLKSNNHWSNWESGHL
ncbi:hypothetical protein AAEO56_08240 [Flavobacterium sp. DGU11]|uniref:Uncharacterized protein n=1 Tax=Flavobacterium arundinis TaxID=3139143 RepID=A0ABU9HVQ2_9FLAO